MLGHYNYQGSLGAISVIRGVRALKLSGMLGY